jgi:hypothetical protein
VWVWVPRIPGVRVSVCHLVSDSCTGGTSRPAVDSRDPRIRQSNQITFHPLTHSIHSFHQFFPFYFFQPPPPPPPAHPPPSSPPSKRPVVLPLVLHPPPLALPRSNLPFETRPPRLDSISVGLPSPATRFSARPPPEPLRDNLLRATTHRAYPTASIWSTLLHPSIALSSPSGLDALAPPQCSAVPRFGTPQGSPHPIHDRPARPQPAHIEFISNLRPKRRRHPEIRRLPSSRLRVLAAS